MVFGRQTAPPPPGPTLAMALYMIFLPGQLMQLLLSQNSQTAVSWNVRVQHSFKALYSHIFN